MPHYVAFLAGINLGNRRIKMDALRARFEELKFRNVATFIASGNVLFESNARDAAKLETQIERHLAKTLGYEVATFVRTRSEVAALAVAQPFAKSDMAEPTHTVLAIFFKTPFAPELARKITAIRTARDEFHVAGRELFWLTRGKLSESSVWTLPETKALKLPKSTMRNTTTLRNIAEQFRRPHPAQPEAACNSAALPGFFARNSSSPLRT